MATISLILTINEDDLDTKGRGEDNMLDELSSIAHEWAAGLEEQCYPRVQARVQSLKV
jgi:hypothetical protein